MTPAAPAPAHAAPWPPPILIDVAEVARALSVSRRTVERLIAAGRLPSRRLGRRRLVPRSAVEQIARRDVPRIAGYPAGAA